MGSVKQWSCAGWRRLKVHLLPVPHYAIWCQDEVEIRRVVLALRHMAGDSMWNAAGYC